MSNLKIALACGIASIGFFSPACAAAQERNFDVPAMPASKAIQTFARQAGINLIAPGEILRGVTTNPVKGKAEVQDALAELLRGTPLIAKKTGGNAYVIRSAPTVRKISYAIQREKPQAIAAVEPIPVEDAQPIASVDEIVVTAQGRAQNLQKVPVAVSVVSGSVLQERNIISLAQLSQNVPSLKIVAAPASDLLQIRGVGSSLNVGFEQSVATFVDGIYRGRSRSSRAALFDLERVEVLKGPQTTFFGNNAIAGALNIVTRKPGDSFAVNGTAFAAAEANEYSIEAGVDIPAGETLSFRLAGKFSRQDGHIKNVGTGSDGPHLNDKVARLSMRWEPHDNIRTFARVDIAHFRDRGVFNTELQRCPPDTTIFPLVGVCARYVAGAGDQVDDKLDYVSATGPSYSNLDYFEAAQNTTVDVGFADLIATTGYYKHHHDQLSDTQPIPHQFASVVDPSLIRKASNPGRFDENFRQFSQELRLQSTGGGPLDYTVGAYFAQAKLRVRSGLGFYYIRPGALAPALFAANAPVGVLIGNREKSRTLSGFAALTFHAGERVRINASARYTNVRKEASRTVSFGTDGDDLLEQYVEVPGAAAILGPALGVRLPDFADPKRTDDKLLPAAGVEFDVARDVMVYATYAKGFKAGGFAGFTTNSIFDPEGVDSYEVGFKSNLFDRMVTLNVAGFHMRYKSLQEATTIVLPNGAILSEVANVASSTSKGIDASLSIRPTTGLSLFADVEYLVSKYDSYNGAPCTIVQQATRPAPCTQSLAGSVRAFAPKFSGSFGFDYAQDITSDIQLRLGSSVYVSTGYYVNVAIDPYLRQPKYAKVDARIAVGPQDRRWELAIVGRNLTDRYTGSYRTTMPSSLGTTQVLPDPRRSIGVQLSVKY